MPPLPMTPDDQDLPLTLEEAANQHIDQILSHLRIAKETRAAALALNPNRQILSTRILREFVLEDDAETASATESVSTIETAGYLLAMGDSWFDYPVRDVLTNLYDHFGYSIESAAHKGDAMESMVSHVGQLDKFARNLDKIVALGATPKAVLLSGGGNDIAGTHFDLFLNNIDLKLDALNEQVIAGVIDAGIATAFRLMILSINRLFQVKLGKTVPILVHGYDYPVPDGRGFLGGWGPLPGPWLKPGFDVKLYPEVFRNVALMKRLIDRFNDMLQTIAQEFGEDAVHYVDLRGTLSNAAGDYEQFWANELHPTGGNPLASGRDGFLLVAQKFAAVLAQL